MRLHLNDVVCRIARATTDLQEARNRAAHRGTVLEKDNIKELCDLSAALLNHLDQHFSAASLQLNCSAAHSVLQ